MLSVYLREDVAYVVPRAGSLSVSWEVGPVATAEPLSVASLRDALSEALSHAPLEADPRFPNPWAKDRNARVEDPVLKALGMRSRAAFERGVRSLSVLGLPDRVVISAEKPDPKSSSGTYGTAWEEELRADAPPDEVSSRILRMLPETPARPSPIAAVRPRRNKKRLAIRALPELCGELVPDLIGKDSAITLLTNDPYAPERLFQWLANYVEEELTNESVDVGDEEQDQLRRVMILIERLLSDGDTQLRESVWENFVVTGLVSRKGTVTFAGPATLQAVRASRESDSDPK